MHNRKKGGKEAAEERREGERKRGKEGRVSLG